MGPGNINFGSASVKLLNYLNDPACASDPLNLQKYVLDPSVLAKGGTITPFNINFIQFQKDIVSNDSPTTAAIAILNVAQGYSIYSTRFGPSFTDLETTNPAAQAGLMAIYYRQGDRAFVFNIADPAGEIFMPDPAIATGGPPAMRDFDLYNQMLNLYGPPPPVPLTFTQEVGQGVSSAGTAVWNGVQYVGSSIWNSLGSFRLVPTAWAESNVPPIDDPTIDPFRNAQVLTPMVGADGLIVSSILPSLPKSPIPFLLCNRKHG